MCDVMQSCSIGAMIDQRLARMSSKIRTCDAALLHADLVSSDLYRMITRMLLICSIVYRVLKFQAPTYAHLCRLAYVVEWPDRTSVIAAEQVT